MQAGEGALAERVEAFEVGTPVQVDDDTAAGVVRRGHHGQGLAAHVEAEFLTAPVDRREVRDDEFVRLVGDVEVDAVVAAALHLVVDGAGDDVTGRELRARVVLGHEARAVGEKQAATLAAYRFGDQKGLGVRVKQAGRVKLDELHVGNAAPGPPGHGNAVAGGGVRIAGVEIDLRGAPARQRHVAGTEGVDTIFGEVVCVQTQAAIATGQAELGRGDQIDGDVIFQQRDARMPAHLLLEGVLDGAPGGVGGVDDTPGAVSAFLREVVLVVGALVLGHVDVATELDAAGDEPVYAGRSAADDELDGVAVAQAGARREGVLDVCAEGVVAAEHGGDAALGVERGALRERLLRQHQGVEAGIGNAQGEAQSREPPADHQHVRTPWLRHGRKDTVKATALL